MEIQGKIVAVLPTRNGTSKTGSPWSSATYVLQTQEMYPRRIAFDVMNENITQFNIRQGEFLKVSFDINAHEYNGKWFNSVKAWAVQRVDTGQAQPQQTAIPNPPQPYPQQPQQQHQSYPQQPQPASPCLASADPSLPF